MSDYDQLVLVRVRVRVVSHQLLHPRHLLGYEYHNNNLPARRISSSFRLIIAALLFSVVSKHCAQHHYDKKKNSRPASAYLRGTRLEPETTRGLANGRGKIETTAHPFTSQG